MSHWSISVEEFTQRYPSPTRWPFSAAISVSLAAHGLMFVAALKWFDPELSPPETSLNPVFDVTLSRANADSDSGSSPVVEIDNSSPIGEQVATPSNLTSQPSSSAQTLSKNPVVVASTPIERLPIDTLSEPHAVSVAEDEIVHTQSESWTLALSSPELPTDRVSSVEVVTPVVEIRPMTDDQRQMLQQQQRKWEDAFSERERLDEEITWQQGKQHFAASIQRQAPQNNTDIERAIVEVSTEVDGVRMTTQFGFKRLAFSHYAQLVDRWDQDVSLSEDEINGRFHSNSRIVVADRRKEPKFNGKVTVASSINMRSISRRSDVFLGGLETRVKRIELPKQLIADADTAVTETEGLLSPNYVFDQDGQIELVDRGGFYWTTTAEKKYYDCVSPCSIYGEEDVTLSVQGRVSGTVLIRAKEKIRITGDVIYAREPEQLQTSMQIFGANLSDNISLDRTSLEEEVNKEQDYLGLLSENYIEIAPPNVTGPGDLTIHGALYAKRRFVVRNYRNRNRGLLTIFGSLTAGMLSASEPRYATRIDFDKRFEQRRLPGFPMTNKFELETWDQQWTVEEIKPGEVLAEKIVPSE